MLFDSSKYSNRDMVIAVIALVILIACLYFLFFSNSTSMRKGTPIAQLTENVGDIRYRPQTDMLWNKGEEKLPLMRFDKVFSGPRSSTKIVFFSGQTLSMGPNSLVEIGLEQNQIELKIIQGSVEVESKSDADLQIKVDQKIVKFKPGRFKAKFNRDLTAGLDLKISEGTPKVSVDAKELPPSAEPIQLESLEEESETAVTSTSTTTLMLEPETTTTSTTIPAEITTTTVLLPRILPRATTTTMTSTTTTLPNEVAVPLVPPKTLQPRQGQMVLQAPDKSAILFRWTGVKGAKEYEIEISNDQNFSKDVKSIAVPEETYLFKESLGDGYWFWRIRTKTESGVSKWSAPRSFRVQQL